MKERISKIVEFEILYNKFKLLEFLKKNSITEYQLFDVERMSNESLFDFIIEKLKNDKNFALAYARRTIYIPYSLTKDVVNEYFPEHSETFAVEKSKGIVKSTDGKPVSIWKDIANTLFGSSETTTTETETKENPLKRFAIPLALIGIAGIVAVVLFSQKTK